MNTHQWSRNVLVAGGVAKYALYDGYGDGFLTTLR